MTFFSMENLDKFAFLLPKQSIGLFQYEKALARGQIHLLTFRKIIIFNFKISMQL